MADNPDERLRAGLHATGIIVHHVDNALAVPQAAVIEETDEPFIFVAVKEDDAKQEKEHDPAGKGTEEKQTEKTNSKDGGKNAPKEAGKDPLVARKVPVRILARSGDLVQIEQSGQPKGEEPLVKEGALVVTDRNYFLADKMSVEIEAGDEKNATGK